MVEVDSLLLAMRMLAMFWMKHRRIGTKSGKLLENKARYQFHQME